MRPHLRLLLISALCLVGLSNLYRAVQSLRPPAVYRKDFSQEDLLARAVLAGVNPYLPQNELARLLDPSRPVSIFRHPTPHPPPVALLAAPLGLFDYRTAAVVWFALEIACLLISVALLVNWWGAKVTPIRVAVLSLLLLSWEPVGGDLTWGQLMLPLFLLLLASWLLLRAGWDMWGGLLLGLVCSLKLLGIPLIIYLAITRRWRACVAACGMVAVLNLLAVLTVGFSPVYFYYREVGPQVTALYRARVDNFSLYALAWRTFDKTTDPLYGMLSAEPLLHAPALAQWLSYALPCFLVALALLLARRTRNFDMAFSLLVCASVVTLPIAWSSYLIWLLIPLTVAARRGLSGATLVVIILTLFSYNVAFKTVYLAADIPTPAPYWFSILSFAPLAAALLLMALLISHVKIIFDMRPPAG